MKTKPEEEGRGAPPRPEAQAAKPKRRVVAHGFLCGGGPCKVIRVYENEPELPKLPAPAGAEPGKLKPDDRGAEAQERG